MSMSTVPKRPSILQLTCKCFSKTINNTVSNKTFKTFPEKDKQNKYHTILIILDYTLGIEFCSLSMSGCLKVFFFFQDAIVMPVKVLNDAFKLGI